MPAVTEETDNLDDSSDPDAAEYEDLKHTLRVLRREVEGLRAACDLAEDVSSREVQRQLDLVMRPLQHEIAELEDKTKQEASVHKAEIEALRKISCLIESEKDDEILRLMSDKSSLMNQADEQKDRLYKKNMELKERIATLSAEIEAKNCSVEDFGANHRADMQAHKDECRAAEEELSITIAKLETQREVASRRQAERKEDLQLLDQRIQSAQASIDEMQVRCTAHAKEEALQLDSLKKTLQQLEDVDEQLRSRHNKYKSKTTKLRALINEKEERQALAYREELRTNMDVCEEAKRKSTARLAKLRQVLLVAKQKAARSEYLLSTSQAGWKEELARGEKLHEEHLRAIQEQAAEQQKAIRDEFALEAKSALQKLDSCVEHTAIPESALKEYRSLAKRVEEADAASERAEAETSEIGEELRRVRSAYQHCKQLHSDLQDEIRVFKQRAPMEEMQRMSMMVAALRGELNRLEKQGSGVENKKPDTALTLEGTPDIIKWMEDRNNGRSKKSSRNSP